jgi:Variant SH3 domain
VDRVVAVRAHAVPERPPFTLQPGVLVEVGEGDGVWPAFVFVTAADGSGWVPSRFLAESEGRTVAVAAYDTTELATAEGEVLEVLRRDDEGGWLWCRGPSGAEGWVPVSTVAPAEA